MEKQVRVMRHGICLGRLDRHRFTERGGRGGQGKVA